MPRANLEKHLKAQSEIDYGFESHPRFGEALAELRTSAKDTGKIPVPELADLFGIKTASLVGLLAERKSFSRAVLASGLEETDAVLVLEGYLPRILQWKTTVQLGAELGLHRNQVQSIISEHGEPKDLMYAFDQKLYVTPSGEKLLREKLPGLRKLEERDTLRDLAKKLRVKPNLLTAFFSARKIALDLDMHGRARLSPEQVKIASDWRADTLKTRRHDDQVIDAVVYRSIIRVAEEKAAMIATAGTAQYRRALSRETGVLYHFARLGRIGTETKRGLYIPADSAATFQDTLFISQAARLLGVGRSTVRIWRRQHKELQPESMPGRRRNAVAMSALVEFAAKKYRKEIHLKEREAVPAILVSWPIHRMAIELGTSPARIAKLLPVRQEIQAAAINPNSMLPRGAFLTLQSILNPSSSESCRIAVETPERSEIAANASRLGLSTEQLCSLAVPRDTARRIAKGDGAVEIEASDYLRIVRLAAASRKEFDRLPLAVAGAVKKMCETWSHSQQIPPELAANLIRPDKQTAAVLETGAGGVSGAAARRLLDLVTKKREEINLSSLQRVSDHLAALKSRAAELHVTAATLINELPIRDSSRSALTARQGQVDFEDAKVLKSLLTLPLPEFMRRLEFGSAVLSSTALVSELDRVARARKIEAAQVYSFLKQFFDSSWPTFEALKKSASRNDVQPIFSAGAYIVLDFLADPAVQPHILGRSTTVPQTGDLFFHFESRDCGPVLDVVSAEGGRTARVSLLKAGEIRAFRV